MKTKKRGFTLIEIIVVLALTPIVVGALFGAVTVGYKILASQIKLDNVEENSKIAVNKVSQQLKTCMRYECTCEGTDAGSDKDLIKNLTDQGVTGIGTPVLYYECFDGSGHLYVQKSDGIYEYDFPSTVVHCKHTGIYECITDEEYSNYNAPTSTDKIDPANISIDGVIPSGCTFEFCCYDNYEKAIYDIGQKADGKYYRYELSIISRDLKSAIEATTPKKVMSYVTSMVVKKNDEVDNVCSIDVKAVDGGKSKELNSDIYMLVKQ